VAVVHPGAGGADQRLVVQQHEVDVEQRLDLGRRLRRQVVLQRVDLGGDGVARVAKPGDLVFGAVGRHVIVRDVDPARRHQHGAPDRDAARHRHAEDLDAHRDDLRAARAGARRVGWRPAPGDGRPPGRL
jgi:hypothetical protein